MPITYLYMDDSGTRNPDYVPKNPPAERDAFCLGGILIREEDVEKATAAHASFCSAWDINYPLHSSEIRSREKNFYWLRKLSEAEFVRFMDELTHMLVSIPALGHACVVHRPGYDARYREEYGRQTWHLCKTAFSVVVERSVKLAAAEGRRLVVYPEWGDPGANRRMKSYYKQLRSEGMPFGKETSQKYKPLTPEQFAGTLLDFALKPKSNALIQLADLYLYPVMRGGYDLNYRPHQVLVENKKLVDCTLDNADVQILGIKYSCFDGVERK